MMLFVGFKRRFWANQMNRTTRIATIEEFGQQLLETGDLDPLYIALVGANLEKNQLRRWLFAYWCCYNAGASSWISECETPEEYWKSMAWMARNDVPSPLGERWPRGHERRHFRGQKAINAVEHYTIAFPQPEMISLEFERPIRINGSTGLPFQTIRDRVVKLPQFGPWIAFKVADMLERVMNVPIDFKDSDILMFDSPFESALEVWNNRLAMGDETSPSMAVRKTTNWLVNYFSRHYAAPPRRDRPVGIQEVETILCKWKSHNNGSYPMGLDTHELHEGLEKWKIVSKTAHRLLLVPIH